MGERWTASRFIEITRGGARADVTADVLALSDAADIYAVRIAMLEDQLRGAVEALRAAEAERDELREALLVATDAVREANRRLQER